MRVAILICIGCLLPMVVLAQYPSQLGRFQVAEKKGCAPFTVIVTNLLVGKCTPGDPCDMDYEGNNMFLQNTFTHTYTQPGTYKLTVLYQTIGADDITITVTPNIQPDFELYGCSGNQVQMKVTDTNYNQYVIDFNDGSPVVVVPQGSLATATHGYASAGNKTVTVRGRDLNADDNCSPNTLPFTALATIPAPFITRSTVTSPTDITLDFTNQNNIQYRLEVQINGTGGFQFIKPVYNASSTTLTNLDPENSFYCFRLGAVDPCAATTVYSNTVCSLDFNLSIQNKVNQLSWSTASAGVNSFNVDRDHNSIAGTTMKNYSDSDIICGTNYCYQITTFYANGSESLSLEKCGTAISTDAPSALANVTAAVSNEDVILNWFPAAGVTVAEYRLMRGPETGGGDVITSGAATSYTDLDYAPGQCYSIRYTDNCGNISLTGPVVCPIQLTGTLSSDNIIHLSWNEYEGWLNGVDHYILEKYDADGILLTSFNTGTTATYDDASQDLTRQVYKFIVRAFANDGGLGTAVSNVLTIIKAPRLFHPTAFTPDHTGPVENETFRVFGQYVASFELQIFNRWGELLFVTKDFESGWDGTYRGKEQPEGPYIFKAKIRDLAGRESVQDGSVLLLRKQ